MPPTTWAAFLPTPFFPFILSHQLLPGPALNPHPDPRHPSPFTTQLLPHLTQTQFVASWWCQDPGKGRDMGKPCPLQLTPSVLQSPSTPASGHALLQHSLRLSSPDPFIPGPAGCKAHTCCSETLAHSVKPEASATPPSHTPCHTPDTLLFLCSSCGTHLPGP